MNTQNQSPMLQRSFGMREAVTITAGSVIGVGLFTVGSNVVGQMGPSVIFATFVALLISIYPALLYAEMGAALPYAGGTYQFASLGLGRPAGVLAGWNFIISLVAVTGGEALAFSYYFKTIFAAFGVELPIPDIALAVIVTAAFIVATVCGVKITGRLQNGFMFFFWGVAVIWFLTMIPEVNLPTFVKAPSFLPAEGQMSFAASVCLVWWCFAGFEACVAMGEEIKYPRINIPRALFLAPFVVFAVNALFQWFLIAITPVESLASLATAQAPYADAMKAAGVLGLPLALLAAGVAFGGDFSTINASIATTPRYLFTMARDGVMPRIFAKMSDRFQTPYVAIITLGVLTVALILTDSLIYIASLSLFADLLYYVIGIVAALVLRLRRPDLERTYKAPLLMVGAPVSAVIYLYMMTELDRDAFFTGVIWCVLGLVIYFVCTRGQRKEDVMTPSLSETGALDMPTDLREIAEMDHEYFIWKVIVGAACVLAVALFALPYLVC
ncbi:APC family permease [Sutterella sp.]|uniref:APC family permease n=1 Tax=Sutterella sp. TaxID=1981025 RepID=UPI0026DF1240|nr:amino acid permease [Sutterella sp.]MDO5532707.1 amino acid permease [Sutterella sp.]